MRSHANVWLFSTAMILLSAGCVDAPAAVPTGLSSTQQQAGSQFASQYEVLSHQSSLAADCLREITDSECMLLVPHDWVQTTPAHFELRGSDDGLDFPQTIKVIEHPSDGSLKLTVDRFARTARAMIENYSETHRWQAVIDGHPAVVIQFKHTDDSVYPGKQAVTRAFLTVKHDRYDRNTMRTVVISCTAAADEFESVADLFDEIACRATLFRNGT